ncbi:hypothetical protein [Actinomadura keratinilytica]|uniref:hypothetical protein n=1 Tax=Actinomadura keratinilytica TaxID=547461 RepID=UPI00362333B6
MGTRTVNVPDGRSLIVNVPSAPVVALPTTLPSRTASTVTPGRPDSPGSGALGVPPPPRVKSNQTVPVSSPARAAGGRAAGRTFSGRSSALTRSSGTRALCPAATGCALTTAPSSARTGEPLVVRGAAPG